LQFAIERSRARYLTGYYFGVLDLYYTLF
jgi:hypothetical protein